MKKILFISILLPALLTGCSSSKISSSWISPEARTMAYGKVAVLAVVKETEPGLREKMETHMAGDLEKLGYSAFSIMKAYGPDAFKGIPELKAVMMLKASGVDAVITIVLLDKKKEKYYTTVQAPPAPVQPQQSRFWGYYTTLSDRIFSAGYYGETTRYFWESHVYDIRENKLVCSLKTTSFDPASAAEIGHEYGKMIIGRLAKYAILIPEHDPLADMDNP